MDRLSITCREWALPLSPKIAVLCLCILCPAGATAQSAGPTAKKRSPALADSLGTALPLDGIVVTATRTGQAVRDMPALVTVVNRAMIESSAAQTLGDLLRTIPGFTMRDYQGSIATHPTRQAPSLRGLGGGTAAGRTLVLMDGVPLADPFAGWVYWARVPLDLVERIEIVRGGGSGIWGSRAMGGVINVITKGPRSSGGQLSLLSGSQSTIRANANVTHRGDRLGIVVAGDFLDTDGFIGVRSDLRGAIDKPAGVKDATGYARVDFIASPSLELTASASYLDEDRKWGSDLRNAGMRLGFVRAGAHLIAGNGGDIRADVFASDQTAHSTFTTETLDRTREDPSLDQFDVPAKSAGATLQWSSRAWTRHELTAGADLFWVDGEANENFLLVQNRFTRVRRVGGEQTLRGIYLQEVIKPNDRWRFLASVRWDASRTANGFRNERTIATNANLIDSTYATLTESTINFSVGLRHALTERLSWRANAYRAYRAPTLNELYKGFREPGNVVAEANSALVSEHVVGFEVGADYSFGHIAAARLTGFSSRVRDPIVEATLGSAGTTGRTIVPCGFVPAGGVCRQRQNLELFRASGVEAELDVRPHRWWTLAGAYLFNPTRVLRAPKHPDLEGNRGSRTPLHTLTTSVRFANPAVIDASVMGRYVGRRFEDDLNKFEIEPFFLVDMRLERRITRRWTAFASVENLADAEFETAIPSSGLVRVGAPRTVLVGSRLRW